MMEFKNKKLLITGGTGSFGNAVCMRQMDAGLSEIRIFSRDEKKQDDTVVHLAALNRHNDPDEIYQTNLR